MNYTKSRKIIYATLIAILVFVNVANYFFTVKYINIFLENRLELATLDLSSRVATRMNSYSDALYSAKSLFTVDPNVTPEKWHTFISNTEIFTRWPGIDVIAYASVIPADGESSLEQHATDLGINNYKVKPPRSTELEAPILYMEPHVPGYENALGFNLLSEPVRKAALNYAIDNDGIALTDLIIPLVDKEKPQKSSGFIMVLPVYRNGSDLSTVEQRRANITGFITAGIRPEDLMKGIAIQVVPGIKFQIFDDSQNGGLSESNLMYNSGTDDLIEQGFIGKFLTISKIQFTNTVWHLRVMVVADTTFANLIQATPYIALSLSLIFTILIFFIIIHFLGKYETAKIAVKDFSERLIAEDAVVDAYEDGIIATDPHGLITIFNKKAEQILGFFEPEVLRQKTFVSLISSDSLLKYAKIATAESNSPLTQAFDYLITKSLIDGYDHLDLEFITKAGRTLRFEVGVRPLYDPTNFLLGYQFIFSNGRKL